MLYLMELLTRLRSNLVRLGFSMKQLISFFTLVIAVLIVPPATLTVCAGVGDFNYGILRALPNSYKGA